MQKETTYRNHYKTNPRLKNTLIFFHTNQFFKTFESDAILVAQLFWFRVTNQDGFNTVWFSDSSEIYLNRLEDAGYAYVILELEKNGKVSVLRKNYWNRSLDLNVSFETFQWLLNDIFHLYEKYSTTLRLVQSFELPIKENTENKEFLDIPVIKEQEKEIFPF